jgi:hypothetical protein
VSVSAPRPSNEHGRVGAFRQGGESADRGAAVSSWSRGPGAPAAPAQDLSEYERTACLQQLRSEESRWYLANVFGSLNGAIGAAGRRSPRRFRARTGPRTGPSLAA